MKQQIILADKGYIIRRGLRDMVESIAKKNNAQLADSERSQQRNEIVSATGAFLPRPFYFSACN